MDEKRVVIKEQSLKDLADILREKSGTTDLYTVDELVEVARSLGLPELEELIVTENGEYLPEVYGYSKVSVNVPDPPLEEITITQGGIYTPTKYGFSKVTADVPTYRNFEEVAF